MILKGKYFLNAANNAIMNLPNMDDGVDMRFTFTLNGTQYSGSTMRLTNYQTSWTVAYYCDTTISETGYASATIVTCAPGMSGTYNYPEARIIDFGEDGSEVTFYSSDVEQMFNLLFIPLPDDEFVSEPNFVQVTNKIMDKMVSEAFSKFNSCKPTMTQLLNSSSGATSVTATLSDYDMVFIRANTYSGYTPLCYAYPSKLMCSVVGTGTFPIQVADNSKYSVFNSSSAKITYASGNSGKLFQVYGLKIPEVN
jgi:hypothetical protein